MSIRNGKKKKKIVFFGDSITDQGAKEVSFIKHILQFLKSESIDDQYELTGAGISGNTVNDLYDRVAKDVLANGADIVVISIGINDILNKTNTGKAEKEIETFEKIYCLLVEKLLAAAIKVVICTLTVIGEKINGSNEQDDDLQKYSAVIKNLSEKYNLPLVDLRKAFTDHISFSNIENKDQGILTYDTVHLNNNGNRLVADEMWKVLQHC